MELMFTIAPPPASSIPGITVHVQQPVPVLQRILVHRNAVLPRIDAGVVHQDANGSQAAADLGGEPLHSAGVRDVPLERFTPRTGRPHLRGSLLRSSTFHVDDGDPSAVLRERPHDGAADAVRAAGDDG